MDGHVTPRAVPALRAELGADLLLVAAPKPLALCTSGGNGGTPSSAGTASNGGMTSLGGAMGRAGSESSAGSGDASSGGIAGTSGGAQTHWALRAQRITRVTAQEL